MNRARFSLLCSALLLVFCAGGKTMDPTLSAVCASDLAVLARSMGLQASSNGATLKVQGTTIEFSARVEDEQVSTSGQHVTGVAVTAQQAGSAVGLVAGSVGVGANRNEALRTAIDEWAHLAGVALLRGLVLGNRADLRFSAGAFDVFPGNVGVRGSQELAWNDSIHGGELVKLFAPNLQRLSRQPHTLSIMAVVDPAGGFDGQALLDGASDPDIVAAVRQFPWAAPGAQYMFKQFYLLVPSSPPSADQAILRRSHQPGS